MKNKLLIKLSVAITFMIIATFHAYSFNYTISFTGSGASNNVGDVVVQNVTKGTSAIVPSGNVLNLSDGPTTTMETTSSSDANNIRFVTDPISGIFTIYFQAEKSGKVQFSVYSLDGKMVLQAETSVPDGENSLQLSLPKGVFLLHVAGNQYTYKAKLVSQSIATVSPEIDFIRLSSAETSYPPLSVLKAKNSTTSNVTTMEYSMGDQLIYKASSGNYRTMLVDVPTESKSVNFKFVPCRDGDGNNYTVVMIGNQTWMVENLKTTHYNDGTIIPNVEDANPWKALTTPAYSNYTGTDGTTLEQYGLLYNWFAVNTRKLCPFGWKVPSNDDWKELELYLGMVDDDERNNTGFRGGNINIADKLKSTTDWLAGTNGNSSGFSALPGGYKDASDGKCYDGGINGSWWTSTGDSNGALFRKLNNGEPTIGFFGNASQNGYAVRAIRYEAKASDLGIGHYGNPKKSASKIWVPIVRDYSQNYDFANFENFTMEAIVKIDFSEVTWGGGEGQNWLNVIMGEEGQLLLRVNRYQEGDGSYSTKFNVATAFGTDLNSHVIESNKWYHVAVTFEKTGANKAEMKLIVNGEVQETNSNVNATKIDLTTLNGLPKWVNNDDHSQGYDQNYEFFIGSFWEERWLNGCISEARLWSKTRTPEELRTNMLGLDTNDTSASNGLVAYWKFSGNEPLKDISGNGFDAVLINGVAITNSNVEINLDNLEE